jgi:threonine/homoserine/homoserine lactone efflux protein
MDAALVATIFALGVALSAAPGALNVETLRRGLHHGFWPAFQIQLGALAGDAVWIVTVTVGAVLGMGSPHVMSACMVAGGVLLLFTAWRAVRPALGADGGSIEAAGRRDWPDAGSATREMQRVHRRGFALGGLLALSSPLTVAFWAAVNGLLRDNLGRAPTTSELIIVGAVYVTSLVTWGVIASAFAVWGRQWLRPAALRVVNVGCAVLLVAWGVQLVGHGAGRLVA